MTKDKLFTPAYVTILSANFLMACGFYLLLPVIPFYLTEVFSASNALAGVILSAYTLAALTIRPFSGYMVDMFARRPLYLLAFFIFTSVFAGYIFAGTLTLFTILRVVHGLSFGTATVSGNTLVIDIMPSSRRGEGLGYYGLTNNIAMAIGPMTGLFLHDHYSFRFIFTCAFILCLTGFLVATTIKAPPKPLVRRAPLSLDRFILVKGLAPGLALLLLSIPYGMTTAYIAMYAREIGVTSGSGLFFTFMAAGMAIARMFSGKQVDRGFITQVIFYGMITVCVAFALLAYSSVMAGWSATGSRWMFFGTALLLGVGFGTMFPAFNTMFVNLAPNDKRGTATSTYLTSWDVGIGMGLTMGGYISQFTGFASAYLFGAVLTLVSCIYFRKLVTPYFDKNRLR